jgi:NADH:ubiquinone oxidoreductase subunit F (NADH-binding)
MPMKASRARSRIATVSKRIRIGVLEGLLIASWVIDASVVFILLCVTSIAAIREILTREIAALQADPPCAIPQIVLRRGAGAYICGEETAADRIHRGQTRRAALAAAIPRAEWRFRPADTRAQRRNRVLDA